MSLFQPHPVRTRLLTWGKKHYRTYPWRGIEDEWLGIVSEILLQRTNVRHVEEHFDEIAAQFPTPKSVLTAKDSELALIEGRFGLDRRLQTFKEVAAYLDSHGELPLNIDELVTIYGIGQYTASAFLSLHAGVRATLIDANIARWLSRATSMEMPGNLRSCKWLKLMVEELTPKAKFREYNYAVLDFTISICKPRKPSCTQCPISDYCDYGQASLGYAS